MNIPSEKRETLFFQGRKKFRNSEWEKGDFDSCSPLFQVGDIGQIYGACFHKSFD